MFEPLLEGRENVILRLPLHRDDEGEAEPGAIAIVERSEFGELFAGQPVEPGPRLLACRFRGKGFRQSSGWALMSVRLAPASPASITRAMAAARPAAVSASGPSPASNAASATQSECS